MITTKKKKACFLPRLFEPRGQNDLVRLGSDHDGGYAVSTDAVASTRHFLSFGLGDNCDFEFDFAAMARLDSMDCYDSAVMGGDLRRQYKMARFLSLLRPGSHRPFLTYYKQYRSLFEGGRPGFRHICESVGTTDELTPPSVAIERIGPDAGRLFLKVDSGETIYGYLDEIIEANALLSGLVIVFHDVPAHLREIQVFVGAMREFMVIDNTTGKNDAGLTGIGLPNAIEMTFSAKFSVEPHIPIAGTTRDGTRLNAPNNPEMMEFEIFYTD